MKHFDDIVSTFQGFAEDRAIASGLGRTLALNRVILDAEIFNTAFFVLAFAQFEDAMNDLCSRAIRDRTTASDWAMRRAWDILDDGNVRAIGFMNRVALLTPKGGAIFNRIRELYTIRNRIAHGGDHRITIEITDLAEELPRILADLEEPAP